MPDGTSQRQGDRSALQPFSGTQPFIPRSPVQGVRSEGPSSPQVCPWISYTHMHARCPEQSVVPCSEPPCPKQRLEYDPPILYTLVTSCCVPPKLHCSRGHRRAQLFHRLLQQVFLTTAAATPKKIKGFY